jgi:hypothetical protein
VADTNGTFLGFSLPELTLKSPFLSLYYCRRILLFPFGNSNAPPNDTVSVYLDYADPKKAPEGWHACAQFALVISNPNDPTIFTVSRAF